MRIWVERDSDDDDELGWIDLKKLADRDSVERVELALLLMEL